MKIAVRQHATGVSFSTLIDYTYDDLLIYDTNGYSTVRKTEFLFYGDLNSGSLIRLEQVNITYFCIVESISESSMLLREVFNDRPDRPTYGLSNVYRCNFDRSDFTDFRVLYLAPSS